MKNTTGDNKESENHDDKNEIEENGDSNSNKNSQNNRVIRKPTSGQSSRSSRRASTTSAWLKSEIDTKAIQENKISDILNNLNKINEMVDGPAPISQQSDTHTSELSSYKENSQLSTKTEPKYENSMDKYEINLFELDKLIKENQNFFDSQNDDNKEVNSFKNRPEKVLDFDPLEGPPYKCAGCFQEIESSYCKTESSYWHVEHFKCIACNESISEDIFYEVNYELFCERDYELYFLDKCSVCSQVIKEDAICADDKTYHPEHFACHSCQKSLIGEVYYNLKSKLFCEKCYSKACTQNCPVCHKSIVRDFINCPAGKYHAKCFICSKCGKDLGSGRFFILEGKLFCEKHYNEQRGNICYQCKQPIIGSVVISGTNKYHPEHFVCGFCHKSVSGGSYKEFQNRPYCLSCFSSLSN